MDAIIVVPNDRVFNVIKKDTPLMKAFERIDDILHDAIGGISELIASAGIINVDFADVKSIMKDAGPALVGVGASAGATRATIAAGQAINSPLLEFSVEGARGLLFGVSGGRDLKMSEINEIAKIITSSADPSAKVIFGAYHDRRLKKGAIKVTLIATGFSGSPMRSSESMNFGSNLFTSAPVEEPTGTPLPLKAGKDGEVKLSKKITVEEKKNVQEEKKKSDTWEIPAFLRKKRR